MSKLKDMWQEEYDYWKNKGKTDELAASEADCYVQDYLEQKADHEYNLKKEEGFFE